ncbi:hypothetical protein HPB49_022000 [Dermacentor silvarum]|uniref:Uncharacterized protein n=1 Tax=Dermacentor silvarum TaxID=543639 RepID=A0ACB8D8C3_DERSI|nr:hypothetical protein HPB49_022000 [Dermacentor silvarum]
MATTPMRTCWLPYRRRYGWSRLSDRAPPWCCVLLPLTPPPPRKDLPLQHALRGAALPASPSAVPTLRVLRARHSNLPETGTVPAVRWPTPDAIVLFEQGQMPALWRTTSSRLA